MRILKKLIPVLVVMTLLISVNAMAEEIFVEDTADNCYMDNTACDMLPGDDVLLGEKKKIGAPTDFKWENDAFGFSFKEPVNATGDYQFSLYVKGENEPLAIEKYSTKTSDDMRVYHDTSPFWVNTLKSGDIYITVVACGNAEWEDSDALTSPVINYTKPEKSLNIPAEVKMEGATGSFILNTYPGTDSNPSWAVEVEYRKPGESFGRAGAFNMVRELCKKETPVKTTLFPMFMTKKGIYRFRVKALSINLKEYLDSDWSEWSDEVNSEEISTSIGVELEELIDNGAGADELKSLLTSKNSNDLATVLNVSEKAEEAVKKAENIYSKDKGITVSVKVSDEVAEKIAVPPAITGAAFNAAKDIKSMIFKVGKATLNPAYDKQKYINSVQISMKLDGASDSSKLEVPVRIKMAVPSGIKIDPSIVILHFRNDGTMERIIPMISEEDGKVMAGFAVTGLGDFVFANESTGGEKPTPTPKPFFKDVKETDWFYKAVKYVYENNIMNGMTEDTFAPRENCDRSMMVQILYNAMGKPESKAANPFEDNKPGKWYYNAIVWAKGAGITSGKSATVFGVADNVTREQMAQFLMNYAALKKYDITATTDISRFEDAKDVSSWALKAVKWANANGIINGKSATKLDPKGYATRAEVAAMIMNFNNKFEGGN